MRDIHPVPSPPTSCDPREGMMYYHTISGISADKRDLASFGQNANAPRRAVPKYVFCATPLSTIHALTSESYSMEQRTFGVERRNTHHVMGSRAYQRPTPHLPSAASSSSSLPSQPSSSSPSSSQPQSTSQPRKSRAPRQAKERGTIMPNFRAPLSAHAQREQAARDAEKAAKKAAADEVKAEAKRVALARKQERAEQRERERAASMRKERNRLGTQWDRWAL